MRHIIVFCSAFFVDLDGEDSLHGDHGEHVVGGLRRIQLPVPEKTFVMTLKR